MNQGKILTVKPFDSNSCRNAVLKLKLLQMFSHTITSKEKRETVIFQLPENKFVVKIKS